MCFKFFSALEGVVTVHEASPFASYTLLQGNTDVRIDANFSAYLPGPKGRLDAWVAAAAVREFTEGRGDEVGGEDGLGTIILPTVARSCYDGGASLACSGLNPTNSQIQLSGLMAHTLLLDLETTRSSTDSLFRVLHLGVLFLKATLIPEGRSCPFNQRCTLL